MVRSNADLRSAELSEFWNPISERAVAEPVCSLTTESQDFSGSDNSIFSTKMPLDLRSKILRLAFGYWGIHVELDLDNPPLKMRSPGVTMDGLKVDTHDPMILGQIPSPCGQTSAKAMAVVEWNLYSLRFGVQ